MAHYEFRFSVDAWALWSTEANDVHDARRKFIATPVAQMELRDIETPIYEIIVSDAEDNVIEVFDEDECAELRPDAPREPEEKE